MGTNELPEFHRSNVVERHVVSRREGVPPDEELASEGIPTDILGEDASRSVIQYVGGESVNDETLVQKEPWRRKK